MLTKRASGILVHVTSLPSEYGIGDFGSEAYKLVDFLVKSGQKYWQILPLNHTTAKRGYCPYNCTSAFAGNVLMISPELLYRQGYLKKSEIEFEESFCDAKVEYATVETYKKKVFGIAFERFNKSGKKEMAYENFKRENKFWLDDFATFVCLHEYFRKSSWQSWPEYARDRKGKAFEEIKKVLHSEIEKQKFIQFLFYEQWNQLKKYCRKRKIDVIGDIAIYVSYESADVWANPEIFKLDRDKRCKYVAGVPADYFSRNGQLWGNPVYDWGKLGKTGYKWWIERIGHNIKLYDLVRIDHFRGIMAYWQVPSSHKTAKNGKWIKGPGEKFLTELIRHFPKLPIIAEDLGYITEDVKAIIEKYNLPTMKVLQFGFDGDAVNNAHILHNHVENSIVYTGTHDNNTIKGWYKRELKAEQKQRVNDYFGFKLKLADVNWRFIGMAMSSVAKVSIVPVQDILGLDEKARINLPGSKKGNWLWRMEKGQLNTRMAGKLIKLTRIYGRD